MNTQNEKAVEKKSEPVEKHEPIKKADAAEDSSSYKADQKDAE